MLTNLPHDAHLLYEATNTNICCNQVAIIWQSDVMQASVDGSVPIDLKLYQQLWGLQTAFQNPHEQGEPNNWLSAVSSIQAVLNTLKEEPIGVASRTTAVPQGQQHPALT